MFSKVMVGGTFNRLHKGHKRILETAFKLSDSAVIGLTTDEFANRFRAKETLSFEERKSSIESYAGRFNKPYEVVPINDSYGLATIDPDVDGLVVSEETLLRAEEINAIRFKKGLEKITLVVIPLELADDGKPIGSERISNGEINEDGESAK